VRRARDRLDRRTTLGIRALWGGTGVARRPPGL